MKHSENNTLDIYYKTFAIPIGIFDEEQNLCELRADFGERLTVLYLKQSEEILAKAKKSSLPEFSSDSKGSFWTDVPLSSGGKLLFGPVQTGFNSDYPYAEVPEYDEDVFYKISLSLCRQLLGKKTELTKRTTNDEAKFLSHEENTPFMVNSQDEIYECIKDGDTDELKNYLNRGDVYSYINEKMKNTDTAKTMYIFNLSRCYHIAVQSGIPLEDMNEMMLTYMNDLKKLTKIPLLKSATLRVMYDFAKIINLYKDQNSSTCVKKARAYISQHIYEQIKIEDIAKYCSVSVSSLQHKFKSETGMTLSEEIQKMKIHKACFFLKYTSLSGTDIALKLGYCTQSYFNKHFKNVMGISPLKYKQQAGE